MEEDEYWDQFDDWCDPDAADEGPEYAGEALLWHQENLAVLDLLRIKHVDFEVIQYCLENWCVEEVKQLGGQADQALPLASGLRIAAPEAKRWYEAATTRYLFKWRPDLWPIPVHGSTRGLALVLQEWAEEPDAKLGSHLMQLPEWNTALGAVVELSKSQPKHSTSTRVQRDLLATFGFPATPGTVQWMTSLRCPELFDYGAPDNPTKGVHIQTFCLLADTTGNEDAFTVSRIDAVHPWCTGELAKTAWKVAQKHDEWWKRLSDRSGRDYKHQRGKQPNQKGLFIKQCISRGLTIGKAWGDWVKANPDDAGNRDNFKASYNYHLRKTKVIA